MPGPASGQVADSLKPAEWGDISRSALTETPAEADSGAAAVILFDVGSAEVDLYNRSDPVDFERRRRVKIVEEAGFDEADVTIPFHPEYEEVNDVEGHTFTLGPDGTVQKTELDDDNVFEEEVTENRSEVRFTLPDLEPGSVIEYSYEVESELPQFLHSWSFQHDVPTRYSSYEVEKPVSVNFASWQRGSTDYAVDTTVSLTRNYGEGMRARWVHTNLPALTEEPFVTTIDNYRAQIRFQLRTVRSPRTGEIVSRGMPASWQKLAKDLLKRDQFGEQLRDDYDAVRRRAERVAPDDGSPREVLQAVHDSLSAAVSWNGRGGIYTEHDLDEVLERNRGSSAEINLLLVAMLREAGLQADPALISTREHGFTVGAYPFVRQFNDVIAAVEVGDETLLVDATSSVRPVGLLPRRALNRQAWIVRKDNPTWTPIEVQGSNNRRIVVRGSLDPDGTFSGQVSIRDSAYAALDRRRTLERDSASALVENAFEASGGALTVSDATAGPRSARNRALQTDASFRLAGAAQATGDFLYFDPVVIDRFEENPLSSETRAYPVEFATPQRWTYILSLQLPPGYTVEDLPKNVRTRLPDKSGIFIRAARATGSRMSLRIEFALGSSRYPTDTYQQLRGFFEQLTSTLDEQIVLKKTEKDASSDPASETGR